MTTLAFKVGDTVREISTGDIGIVCEKEYHVPIQHINVDWTSGAFIGETLHVDGNAIELVEASKDEIKETNAEFTAEFTADQARAIADKVLENELNEELDNAINKIKTACNAGEYEVYVPVLKARALTRLRELGFKFIDNRSYSEIVITWSNC